MAPSSAEALLVAAVAGVPGSRAQEADASLVVILVIYMLIDIYRAETCGLIQHAGVHSRKCRVQCGSNLRRHYAISHSFFLIDFKMVFRLFIFHHPVHIHHISGIAEYSFYLLCNSYLPVVIRPVYFSNKG